MNNEIHFKFRISEEYILQSFLPFLESHHFCYCSFIKTTFQQILRQNLIPTNVIRIKEWMLISIKKLKFTKDISQTLFHLFQTNFPNFSLENENAVKLEPFFLYIYFQMFFFEKFNNLQNNLQNNNNFNNLQNSNEDIIYNCFCNILGDLLDLIGNENKKIVKKNLNFLNVFIVVELLQNSLQNGSVTKIDFNIANYFPFFENNLLKKDLQNNLQNSLQNKKYLQKHKRNVTNDIDMENDPELSQFNNFEEEETLQQVYNFEQNLQQSEFIDIFLIKDFILQNLQRTKLNNFLKINNISNNYIYFNPESTKMETFFEIENIFDHSYICILQKKLQTICIKNCKDCTIVLGPVRNMIHVTNCNNIKLICPTNAIKIYNCINCQFYLCCNNPPLLFTTNENLKFAPFNTFYKNLQQQIDDSNIDPNINYYKEPFIVNLDILQHYQNQQLKNSLSSSPNNSKFGNLDNFNSNFNTTTMTGNCGEQQQQQVNYNYPTSPTNIMLSSSPSSSSNNSSPTSPINFISSNYNSHHNLNNSNLNNNTIYSIIEPKDFHIHIIPFENTNSNNPSNNVQTISEILRKIPCPLPREYLLELQKRMKTIANLFDKMKLISKQVGCNNNNYCNVNNYCNNTQQHDRFNNNNINYLSKNIDNNNGKDRSNEIQMKMMEFMNRKFREWLNESGLDKEYKIFLLSNHQDK
ncbi:hypothetical protein ABK040_000225 [Willaertia magna]